MAVKTPDFRPDLPHELSRLPPTAEVETRAVLRACIEARVALAAMDQATRRIPNPTMLINTLPLLEAADSSRIENIVTTTDELFRYANTEVQSNWLTSPGTAARLWQPGPTE